MATHRVHSHPQITNPFFLSINGQLLIKTKGVKRLLRQTDDAFCKIKREWWLIEVEQIHQPFVLSPAVQAGAEQFLEQLTKQLQ